MKNSKAVIAVLCAIVLIFSLAACAQQKAKTELVAQVVTDENGQAVTGADGEVITEEVMAQIVTDANGQAVTEVVTGTDGKPLTTVVNDKYVNVTQVVTTRPSGSPSNSPTPHTAAPNGGVNTKTSTTKSSKKSKTTKKTGKSAPKAPAKIKTLSATATSSSVKLIWKSVKCSGYQIGMSKDGKSWKYLEASYNKGYSYTVKNLESNTNYYFRVRAYNKNSAGKTPSEWTSVKTKTKVSNISRKINITVIFSNDSSGKDTLYITVNKKLVEKAEVTLLPNKKYTFTTKEEYTGEVEITAKLKSHGSKTIKTDKSKCTIELSSEGIPVLIDDEDE